MPTLYVRFGGYYIEVKNTDYATPNPAISDNCQLLLGNNEDFWALGMVVMRGYYVTHDIANDRVGFVPQKDSTKAVPVYEPAKADEKNTNLVDPVEALPDWAIWLIVGVAIATAIVVVVVLVLVPEDEEGDMTDSSVTIIIDNFISVSASKLLANLGDVPADDFVQMI